MKLIGVVVGGAILVALAMSIGCGTRVDDGNAIDRCAMHLNDNTLGKGSKASCSDGMIVCEDMGDHILCSFDGWDFTYDL